MVSTKKIETNISPAFSLEGWDIKKWIVGNKDSLKFAVPMVLGFIVSGGFVEAGVAGIVGKAILDIVDFYVSQVSLS